MQFPSLAHANKNWESFGHYSPAVMIINHQKFIFVSNTHVITSRLSHDHIMNHTFGRSWIPIIVFPAIHLINFFARLHNENYSILGKKVRNEYRTSIHPSCYFKCPMCNTVWLTKWQLKIGIIAISSMCCDTSRISIIWLSASHYIGRNWKGLPEMQ